MNIETLKYNAAEFKREVIDSGFKRNLEDYADSIPASRDNILVLREMAGNVLKTLETIYSGDLPRALSTLLPTQKIRPFTEFSHREKLQKLISDPEVSLADFSQELQAILQPLKQQIESNIAEIDRVEQFVSPYVTEEIDHISTNDSAVVSIIFNDRETTSSLTQFTKVIGFWNRTLPIYHQLLKSESPEDISIIEVQNGSIDLIVNLDVDIAIDLAKLFKVGFEVFAAYLAYRKMIEPLVKSFHGNKKLIADEEQRDQLMLENIGEAVKATVTEQHKSAKKVDKAIESAAVQKKIEQVTKLVTSHIVKGNDVRILALPENTETSQTTETDSSNVAEDLREQSTEARRALRKIPTETHLKLLEAYKGIKDEDSTDTPNKGSN